MEIRAKQGSLTEIACDVLIVNLFEGVKTPGGGTGAVDKALGGLISSYVIKKEEFKGKLNQMYVLPTHGKIPADKILLVGLGKSEDFSLNKIREVTSKTIKKAKTLKAKTVATILHGAGTAGLEEEKCARMITEGALIGNYSFDKYKSKKEDEDKENNKEIQSLEIVEMDAAKLDGINRGIETGRIIAEGVNLARDLQAEPACTATPAFLAETALALEGLECKVLEKDEIKKLGMGLYLAVGQGSALPPKFIHMKYKPAGKAKKKIAVIGKGITFDSGGLDLKPAASMRMMKEDMSGSAAALGIMKAVAQLKPDVEVHGIIAACENMPGSKAYRPGDVITAMSGKTVEVDNTDAEGRLTLADAIYYAVKEDVDEIIDIATLTGACMVALGSLAAGIMGSDEELVKKLITSADEGGERFWHLPIYDEHKEELKSDIADMKNCGSRYGGALTAGAFLKEFTEKKKWAHIDIAGTAWIDKELKEMAKGPTGSGVRAIVNYILSL